MHYQPQQERLFSERRCCERGQLLVPGAGQGSGFRVWGLGTARLIGASGAVGEQKYPLRGLSKAYEAFYFQIKGLF